MWETVPLREVAHVDARVVAPKDIPTHTPYVGLEHIGHHGALDLRATAGASVLKSAKNKFNPQHVLFGKLRPNLAKVARPPLDGVCSTDIYPLAPSSKIDRDYLANFLLSPQAVAYAVSRAAGVNLPRVSWSSLGDLPVPLPRLTEQRRIAAILDEADALRTKHAEITRIVSALQLSAFTKLEKSLVGSTTAPLGSIADVGSGITKGRKTPTAALRSTPYMTVANVQDKNLDLSTVKHIDASDAEIERYRLRLGDLLLTEGGDPDKLGRGVVWRDELPLSIHQNHVFRVRLRDTGLHPLWLNWEVGSNYGKRYFLRAAKQTTGIATINSTQLKEFPVRIPTPSAMMTFVDELSTICVISDAADTRSTALDALFASLQYRAFRGQL